MPPYTHTHNHPERIKESNRMGRSVEAPGDALIYSTFVLVDKGGWIRRGSERGLRKKRQAKRGHADEGEGG